MSAAKGKTPTLILFIRLLRTVRRLALKGMIRMKMKVKLPASAIYALSGLRRWVCDEFFGVLSYHAIEHGWCKIRDDFVQGLHLDQESIKLFQG